MGRSRRSPAQKAALARASQIALERHRNKLGFPSASPLSGSSHPQALPNSIDQGNISQSKQDRTELTVDNNSESVRSAAKRALKREELKLARERERVAALERKLQDARRRESELQEEVKALQKECRLGEQDHHRSASSTAVVTALPIPVLAEVNSEIHAITVWRLKVT